MIKIQILKETLEDFKVDEKTKRDAWKNSGSSTSGDAYNDWNNVIGKIEQLTKDIEKEEGLNTNKIVSLPSKTVLEDKNIEVKSEQNLIDSPTETLNKTYEELKNKMQHFKATKKDAHEFLIQRDEVLKMLIGDTDQLLGSSFVLKDEISDTLFSKIISSETLTEIEKFDINKVRENKDGFEQWHRSLVVSALTISIIKYKKFDYRKADYLLDFLSDQEDGVWQKALVGLYISLMYRDNKWQKYTQFKQRLISLQQDPKIQDGIHQIDTVWRMGLYEFSFFSTKINDIDFFADKPQNWFVPFHKENKILKDALEEAPDNIDTEDFKDFILKAPFPDCFKYILCHALVKGKIKKMDDNEDKNVINEILKRLNLANNFEPYQNIISNLYYFFTYFPKENLKELFEKKRSIVECGLKDIILDRKNKLRIATQKHLQDNNFGSAKLNSEELLQLAPNDKEAILMYCDAIMYIKHADIYEYDESREKALAKLNNIDFDLQESIMVQYKKRECYEDLNQYNKALEASKKLEGLEPNNVVHKLTSAYYFTSLEIFTESDNIVNTLNLNLIKSEAECSYMALINAKRQNHKDSIAWFEKCIKLNSEKQKSKEPNWAYHANIARLYIQLKDSKNAIHYLNFIKNKDENLRVLSMYGQVNLYLLKDYTQSDLYYKEFQKLLGKRRRYRLSICDIVGFAIWNLKNKDADLGKELMMKAFRFAENTEGFMKQIEFEYPFFVELFSYKFVNDLIKELEEAWNEEKKKNSKSLKIEKQSKSREIQQIT